MNQQEKIDVPERDVGAGWGMPFLVLAVILLLAMILGDLLRALFR